MKNLFVLLALLCSGSLLSQFDLSGTLKNENGELLEGATIFLRDSEFATISDSKGQWSLSDVPHGLYTLKASYLGYKSIEKELDVIDDFVLDLVLTGSLFDIDEIQIKAVRISNEAPFAFKNVSQEELEKTNLGQDIPILLKYTPSVVTTSDAGAGIGYTGLRIRGSDASRVNVTINGIPLNDSESQSVFWVNMPDFSSSVESIQIQRGVGTSTNGSGAFGGTISLNTNQLFAKPYAEVNATYGSFNTQKLNLKVGTGLMNDKYAIDFRLSRINSDGYIDRAYSKLSSWYFSGTRLGDNSVLKLNAFSGNEKTYQAWYGSPIEKINNDSAGLQDHFDNNYYPGGLYQTAEDSINLFDSDRKYNYYTYGNEIDDYVQSHVQLLYDKELKKGSLLNVALHYTRGQGYFEQYRIDDEFANYGIAPFIDSETMDTFNSSDLTRRRWLDNHFFGGLLTLKHNIGSGELTYGGASHYYLGDHYGRVVWAEKDNGFDKDSDFYFNTGKKLDYNTFAKIKYPITDQLTAHAEMQMRGIDYSIEGVDIDSLQLGIDTSLLFLNPKIGFNYNLSDQQSIYGSLAVANREPDRNDFIDKLSFGQSLSHETMFDYELGYRYNSNNVGFEANAYFMDYNNQLVLTGELNDVGSSLRTNVKDSYRMGLELAIGVQPIEKLSINGNVTLSQNKIKVFEEVIYDYSNNLIIRTTYNDTDISFSPSVIAGSRIGYQVSNDFEVELMSKFVSKQFLDNTSDDTKSLDAYFVNDIRLSYDIKTAFMKTARINLLVNNVLNTLYSSNGYTYSYIVGNTITERYLYPQATTNFLLSCTIGF